MNGESDEIENRKWWSNIMWTCAKWDAPEEEWLPGWRKRKNEIGNWFRREGDAAVPNWVTQYDFETHMLLIRGDVRRTTDEYNQTQSNDHAADYTGGRRNATSVTRCMVNKSSAVAEMGDRGHMGQKEGGCCAPFAGAGTPSKSSTMWPGPRSTSVPSGVFIHPAIWPQ